MNNLMTSGNLSIRPIETLNRRARVEPSVARQRNPAGLREEILPFTVRMVRSEDALNKAVQIRHSAYARHLPDFAETLRVPEANDWADGTSVLLAESKLDGTPLGTMRIQTNQLKPLTLEQSLPLPQWLHDSSMAEATRLAVSNEKTGRLVKSALFKAYYQFCQMEGIEWMVITARSPIDRQYQRLLFEDVYPGIGYVPMLHVNNLPHRVMSFEIATAHARWTEAQHPLLDFVCNTFHSDIDIEGEPLHAPGVNWVRKDHALSTAAM